MAAQDVLYEYNENFVEDMSGYWKLQKEGSTSCPATGTLTIPGGIGPLAKMLLSFAAIVGVTYTVETGDLK